jgi:hypothetical protein
VALATREPESIGPDGVSWHREAELGARVNFLGGPLRTQTHYDERCTDLA